MAENYDLTGEQRRVLAIAVQILEDLPPKFQPSSDMEDMRMMLRGKSCGRDGFIYDEALTLALAFRAMTVPVSKMFESADEARNAMAGYNNRWSEFEELFALVVNRNPVNLALAFTSACGLVKRALLAETTDDSTSECHDYPP